MSREERFFWIWLLILMSLGYAFAILQVVTAAGVTPEQILTHYRGNEAEMLAGMAFSDLVRLSHIHASSMSLLLAPAAFVLVRYVETGSGWKRLLVISGFGGIVLDLASWWGLVYIGAAVLPLLFAAGVLFGFGMVGASFLSLRWLWMHGGANG